MTLPLGIAVPAPPPGDRWASDITRLVGRIYRDLARRSNEEILEGVAASRPAANGSRRFYFATDTNVLSYDDGAWNDILGGGPAGSSAPGPPGLDGMDGEDGLDGRPGSAGAAGAAGATGPQGLQGAPGLDGQDGQDGEPGPQGAIGPIGPQGPAGAGTVGTAILDFGAFPGTDTATVLVTGQAAIVAGSVVDAWIRPTENTDHTVDEQRLEELDIDADTIVAGTGFTIFGRARGTPVFGQFNVAWSWQ